MGAIIMDDCIVESNSIIAAGAVVTKKTKVEDKEDGATEDAMEVDEPMEKKKKQS